ncbi:MAG: endonuclease domain-containing protein [Phycisphaerales bacterium JB040]
MPRPNYHKPVQATSVSTERARDLRHDLSLPEALLWRDLKGGNLDGHRFRRQHPLGPYIADFYVHKLGLVIEIDGGSHQGERKTMDAVRDQWMNARGLKVLRFRAKDVLGNFPSVLSTIRREAAAMRESRAEP